MKRLTKSLAIIFVVILLLGRAPAPARATGLPVVDFLNNAVNWLSEAGTNISAAIDGWDKSDKVLNMALKRVAAKVLLKTTQRIVNWGTTGFQGNPFYVQDQGSFFRSIADQQLANTVDEVLKEKCSGVTCPYARSTAKALIKGYAASTPGGGTKYNLNQTLGSAAQDFKDDFSVGGWKGWDAYTQNPQNNYLGAFIETSKEVSDRIEDAQNEQKDELLQNNGFLSLRVCAEKKPRTGSGTTIEPGTKTYPHTALSGKQVYCVEDPKTQADLWKCTGTCSTRDQELANTTRTQWEGRKCYDEKSKEVTDVNVGLGLGNSTLGSGLIGLNGDTKADDCARYETKTPGSLIQQQLNKALLVPIEEKLNAKSSGGTLVDMLVDLTANLVDKGLTSLVSNHSNKKQTVQGGSSTGNVAIGNNSSSWYTGNIDSGLKLEDETTPGEPSDKLKDAIDKTQQEIDTLSQIRAMGVKIPEETMSLDRCLPGPDVNWEARLRSEFQDQTKKIERIADKDTNRGDRADKILSKLKIFLEEQVQKTKFGLIGVDGANIPSASIIQSRVIQKDEYIAKLESVNARMSSKVSVLAILEDIEKTIRNHPSQIIGGQFVVNTQQDIINLRSQYRQIERDIGNEESLSDINGELNLFKQDYKRSFDTSSADSLISKCTNERGVRTDIATQDDGQTLFCEWDALNAGTLGPSALGSVLGIFGLFGSLNLTPDVQCTSYYRSNLGDYIK